MKTIFDTQTQHEMGQRLAQLNVGKQPLWGNMTAPQMLKHLRIWEEMIHNNKAYPRPLIGRLIGPLVMKSVLKKPELAKNTPTIPEMRMTGNDIDFEAEQQKLTALLSGYANYNLPDYSFIHPFFGKMTREQIGRMAYMHLDHHLRQFGI